MTSSNSTTRLRMSKLKPSTRVWALSIVLPTMPRLDRDVVLVEAHALHEARHALGGEPLHEVVVERQVEARRARIALAAGAATELVVDAAAVVALGADDVEAARRTTTSVVLLGDRLGLREGLVVRLLVDLGRVQALSMEQIRGEPRRVAAEQDVRAAAGHVRGDRDRATPPGLGDDPRLPSRGTWRSGPRA